MSDIKLKGIDISKYNGNIDFARLKNKVDFVILRSSIGVPSVNPQKYGMDTKFKENVKGCIDNNIPFGCYHYSTAVNTQQAQEEAELVINCISGMKLAYPIYIDLEDNTLGALSRDEISSIAIAFIDRFQEKGYYAGVYTNKNWLENKVNYSRLSQYPLWIAQWASMVTWSGKYQMWQYTSDGKVEGINGRVDMDECYENYPVFMAEKGLNGFSENQENPAPQPSVNIEHYVVQRGDTMYAIAQRYGITLDELKKANPQIPDYNLIYSGQIINVPVSSDNQSDNKVTYSKGEKITLQNAPLYSSAGGKAVNTVSGVYYLYDGIDINGFYRITNSLNNVGKEPIGKFVTGFIKKESIK